MVQATVLAALATLGHAAARPALAGAVFAAEDAGADCSSVVAAALQVHRESEVRASATDQGTIGECASMMYLPYTLHLQGTTGRPFTLMLAGTDRVY